MQMMRGKTGALLAYCAETGVAIGEDVPPEKSSCAEKMAEFAHLCGLAFQMKDDLLGIFGDESKFGKPIGSDIREGKRTVLMLRTLQNASDADAKSLLAVLGKKEATTEEIENARAVIVKTGAEKAVVELSDAYVDQALRILETTLPAGMSKAFLRQWALSMVARSV
jgi:geranylgeranyl diphosphate synthase type I